MSPRTKIPRYRRPGIAPVNPALLAPVNSYGEPEFVRRGHYVDVPFACATCGKPETWTAWQQKWWYETAKSFVYSGAARCRSCRRIAREAARLSREQQAASDENRRAKRARRIGKAPR